MYGPRAFVGAINILTLDAGENPVTILKNKNEKDKKINSININANLSSASFRTKDIDMSIGWTTKNFKLS